MTTYPFQLTHLDKPLFPADRITKGDLVKYYEAVAPHILPHLRDRPVNLERFPGGIGGRGFFQQAMPRHYPAWMTSIEVAKESGSVRHVVVQDRSALVYLANQNCITLHAWLSQIRRLDYPDQMIFDLDPPDGPEKAAREAVRDAARVLGELLRELGATPFLKTSGSRGYHVVVPLDGEAPFDAVRDFAQAVAGRLAGRDQARLTTEVRKRSRGDRIYIDTLRNAYAHTAVAPFTVRARRGAPVATPITWEELEDPAVHPAGFTIRNVLPRLESGPDPWRDFRRRAKSLKSLARYI
jgi:bifunctional non-homologous end joining protein LigD